MKERFSAKERGTSIRSKQLGDIANKFLFEVSENYKKKPLSVIESWPKIIGKLSQMTKVISFKRGLLVVGVKSSTLYSLLTNYEKGKILKKMQEEFSKDLVKDIAFRML